MSDTALFKISKDNKHIGFIEAEQRFYPIEKNKTTEAGIYNFILSDLYITFGEGNIKDGWTVRAYYNPLVKCIWFGTALMALGGLVSVSSKVNRKYI